MEDSFKVRVDRTFGSLASSFQSISSSLWSLTDEEIERREWNRDPMDTTAEEEPVGPRSRIPSNLDEFFWENGTLEAANENPRGSVKVEDKLQLQQLEDELESLNGDEEGDLESLDDDDEEDDDTDADCEEQKASGNSGTSGGSLLSKDFEGDDDELEIKNSIGMDCTLDYEEEEDEFDKVAVGRIKSTDRIYLGNFGDYGVLDVTNSELPDNFGDTCKDPRANHLAAEIRLKEDEEAANNISSLQVSSETTFKAAEARNNLSEDGSPSLKTILKRKDSEKDSSTEKRVRFAPGCKGSDEKGVRRDGEGSVIMCPEVENCLSTVPDYICNPTRYTHYTFDDSNDMDEKSNQQACMDFLNALRKSKQLEPDEPPADLSQPVIFNPKRKSGDRSVAKSSGDTSDMETEYTAERSAGNRSLPLGIVAEIAQVEDDPCLMDEDFSQERGTQINRRTNKTTRQYRLKANSEINEPSS